MTDPTQQRESDVRVPVIKYAREKYGWIHRKQAGKGHRGKLDEYFLRKPKQIVFVEFKAPGKKPTRLQEVEIQKLTDMGFPVYVIDTIQGGMDLFDELQEVLA